MTGGDLQIYLIDNLTGGSSSLLAGLLGVTELTMRSWDSLAMEELRKNKKSVRLMRAHRAVKFARDYGVPSNVMLNFVHEPADGSEDGSSLLFIAIYTTYDLAAPLTKMIEKWKEVSK